MRVAEIPRRFRWQILTLAAAAVLLAGTLHLGRGTAQERQGADDAAIAQAQGLSTNSWWPAAHPIRFSLTLGRILAPTGCASCFTVYMNESWP